MFMLVLRKLHNASEQFLDHLKVQVENLRISKTQGEDVDKVVSLLNSTYDTFKSISTPGLNRVPLDWSKTLCSIFQTSSVREFNDTFADEEKDARKEADKNGGQPEWPTHDQLVNLATATYNRLKQTGHWDVPKAARARAYFGNGPSSIPNKSPTMDGKTCWNCGSPSHLLPDCPKPFDKAMVDKNRQRFFDSRNKKGGFRPTNRPPFKRVNGKPMIMNKKGAYVLNQKQYKLEQRKASANSKKKRTSATPSYAATSHVPTPAPGQESRSPAPILTEGSQQTQVAHVTQVREALRQLL